MRFFHFKDGDSDFESHIFAWTEQRAAELFLIQQLVAQRSLDCFLWRELTRLAVLSSRRSEAVA
jgi:hypothetical protein